MRFLDIDLDRPDFQTLRAAQELIEDNQPILFPGESGILCSVGTDDPEFLRQLDELGIGLGTRIQLEDRYAFDGSARIRIRPGRRQLYLAEPLMRHLFIQRPAQAGKRASTKRQFTRTGK